MSDKKISELTAASALSGDELVPIVQSAETKRTTLTGIADWIKAFFSASDGSSLVSFLPSGTGATTRNAQDKMRDLVSTADYSTGGQFATATQNLTNRLGVLDIHVKGWCFSNFKPSNTRFLRNGIANVRQGSDRMVIACLGDSTTTGTGAGTGTGEDGAFAKAYPSVLASILNKRFAPAVGDSALFGQISSGTRTAYTNYDTRLVLGTGWIVSSLPSIAYMWRCNSPDTGTLAFTPSGEFDSIDVYYVTGASGSIGTFTIDVDGGSALATVDGGTGVSTFAKKSVSCTLGTHTVNIQRTTGGNIFIAAIVTYDSTNKAIEVWNWGWGGTNSTTWADNSAAWSPIKAIPAIAPDVTLYGLGLNDEGVTTVATFKTNVQTTIDAILSAGDCIIVIPDPPSTSSHPQADQDAIREALYDLAATNDLPVIDRTLELESFTQILANGWAGGGTGHTDDPLHLNANGYAVVASLIAKALMHQFG